MNQLHKFWLRDANRSPVTLVLYEVQDGSVVYATATQHPNDPRPDLSTDMRRKLPHMIVEGRFNRKRTHRVASHGQDPISDIAADMLARALSNGREDTQWALAAAAWLKSLSAAVKGFF